jgi:uncharacterized protein (DUF1810 family)
MGMSLCFPAGEGAAMQETQEDRFNLQRFLEAQGGVIERVYAELRTGQKRSHWMWFVFPQIRGLGSSEMAMRYAISGREEARAYLDHPVLGPRLQECAGVVVDLQGRTIEAIFGYPDDLKFHSSMTLFDRAAALFAEAEGPSEGVFHMALKKYFGGKADEATLARL